MREALRSYRQMVYLDDLTDAEFVVFTDDVAGQLENSYPVYGIRRDAGRGRHGRYGRRITIVDELDADAHNAPHHPPCTLVAQGTSGGSGPLPAEGVLRMLRRKVNAAYATTDQFFNAILADTTDLSRIRQMETVCQRSFSWVVTEVNITETIPPPRQQLRPKKK